MITQKQADYLLFKRVFEIVKSKEHLSIEGVKKIIAIKGSMNNGLSEKAAFSDGTPVARPLVELPENLNPYWLAGFTTGEGCFFVSVFKSLPMRGESTKLIFQITQHCRDEKLMKSLVSYLGCGRYVPRNNKDFGEFIVTKFEDVTEKIIPFFEEYQIVGSKSKDYSDFKKVALLMKNREHLTAEGLENIRKIKAGMNKGRLWS